MMGAQPSMVEVIGSLFSQPRWGEVLPASKHVMYPQRHEICLPSLHPEGMSFQDDPAAISAGNN
jgi:hypothetical protein